MYEEAFVWEMSNIKLLYPHNIPLHNNQANIIQVLHMCNAFQKNGIDTTLVIPVDFHSKDKEIKKIIEEKLGSPPLFEIVKIRQYNIFGRGAALCAAITFFKIFYHRNTFDYCFTRSIFTNHFALKIFKNVIFEAHGSVLQTNSLFLNKIYSKVLIKDSLRPNQILFITISQALAQVWEGFGVPPKKIHVSHDGVSTNNCNINISKNKALSYLKIKTNNKIVTYAGSLYRDRGISEILKLAQEYPDVSFFIVGGPDIEKEYYQSQCIQSQINNISFIGHVPHYKIKYYLAAADVLLMMWSWDVPTIDICSPLKVFEYMASGRIIVGYGFPTIKEVLDDGHNALLASPDNFKELKEKLNTALLLNYPNQLSENSKKHVLENFTWETRANNIIRKINSKSD